MSLKAIDINEVRDFILPEDKENPTIFKIGVIDSRIRSKIRDETATFDDALSSTKINQLKIATTGLEYVRFGLKGFENFLDKNDKPIEFKTETIKFAGRTYEVVAESILNMLSDDVIMALGAEIMKGNKLSEKEIKNST